MGSCCTKSSSPRHHSESYDAKRSIANDPTPICPRLSRIAFTPSPDSPTVTGPVMKELDTASYVPKACRDEALDPTKVSVDEESCIDPSLGPGITEEECPSLINDDDSDLDLDPATWTTKHGDAFLDPEVGILKAVYSYQELCGLAPEPNFQLEATTTSTSETSTASAILPASKILRMDNTTNKLKCSELKNSRDMLASDVPRSAFSEDPSRSLYAANWTGFQPWTEAGIMEETCPHLYDDDDDLFFEVQHGGTPHLPWSPVGPKLVGRMAGFTPWIGPGINEETCPQLVSDDEDDAITDAEKYELGTHKLAVAILKNRPRLRNWFSWKTNCCLEALASPPDSTKPKGGMSALDNEILALEAEVFGDTKSWPESSESAKKHDELSELGISEEICPELINADELDPGPESTFCAQESREKRIDLMSELDRARAQISKELNNETGAPRGIMHHCSDIIPILEILTDEIWTNQSNRRLREDVQVRVRTHQSFMEETLVVENGGVAVVEPQVERRPDHEPCQQPVVTMTSQDSRTSVQTAGNDTPTRQLHQVTTARSGSNRRRQPKTCRKALNALIVKLFK